MNDYLEFAKLLAHKAGDIMLKYFDQALQHHIKEDKQIVTIADEEINQMVIEQVEAVYPEHSILGEEASVNKKSDYVWVCDPIDGTVPYSRGIPVSVFSLALVENGNPIVGVVYDPYTKRLYSAAKSSGAFLNDNPIKVSTKKLARHSIINVEWWSDAEYEVEGPLHKISAETNTYVLKIGSIIQASCLVAAGKFEAAVFSGTVGKYMDIAAIKVIVEEAGGKVTDLFGDDQRYDKDIKGAVISNELVHSDILNYLKPAVEK
jgi:fructose-1,6-bisphosphatase/inositol monophosphatase family enzyme